MAKTAIVNARVDRELKDNVDKILKHLGLTASDVINMLYAQIRLQRAIPFEISLPDEKLIDYLEKTATGFTDNAALLKEYGLSNYMGKSKRSKIKEAQ